MKRRGLPRMLKVRFVRTLDEMVKAFQVYQRGDNRLFFVVYHQNHRAEVRGFGTGFGQRPGGVCDVAGLRVCPMICDTA